MAPTPTATLRRIGYSSIPSIPPDDDDEWDLLHRQHRRTDEATDHHHPAEDDEDDGVPLVPPPPAPLRRLLMSSSRRVVKTAVVASICCAAAVAVTTLLLPATFVAGGMWVRRGGRSYSYDDVDVDVAEGGGGGGGMRHVVPLFARSKYDEYEHRHEHRHQYEYEHEHQHNEYEHEHEHEHTHDHHTHSRAPPLRLPIPMPHGVNLASWLSLEDYFYVGDRGALEVATPDGAVVARCLPPLHVDRSTGPTWNSETDLFVNLSSYSSSEDGGGSGSVARAIRIFHAFRISYMDWDEELGMMSSVGVRYVRVPLSWCLTDHDPSDDATLMAAEVEADDEGGDGDNSDGTTEKTLLERYTCVDPFFATEFGENVTWPAVPRSILTRFLRACSRHGIKATLDLHTYPGGTSLGTFSGVWPRRPLFWKYDDPENTEDDLGRRLYRDFLDYVQSLAEIDPVAFDGVGAISPMNEPAHLAGLFGPGSINPDVESFLPSLPDDLAKEYLSELNGDSDPASSSSSTKSSREVPVPVPDGPHLRVLLWLRDAVSYFRSTSLSDVGVEIHVNVHESILVPSIVPDDVDDTGGRHPQATSILASWWAATTTSDERATWAVLDMHHYHAWEPRCQGTVDPASSVEGEGYTCGDEVGTDEVLDVCTSWAGMFRSAVDGQAAGRREDGFGKDDGDGDTAAPRARLASAEFSASTHHSVLKSCLDVTTLRKSYLAQVEAADDAGVDLYWWSWKMPHGGAFRRAWSFKHLMYLLGGGVEGFFDRPDESEIKCGE